MGEDGLTLYYSLPQHIEIPVGSYCDFQGSRYVLLRPENFKMRHTRFFEYTVVMDSEASMLSLYKFRNTVDGRLQFSLTATAAEHLQMLVDNLNRRDTGWKAGECVDSTEKLVTYSHAYCSDALTQMAETFNTEYEITGKTVSLKKVEYNRDNPLPLAYGKGKGFRPGVGRSNFEDSLPVSVLYVQGGTRNIDAGKYGNSELLLPKGASIRYDGTRFEDEEGFDAQRARTYVTDRQGYYIMRQDMPVDGMDDSLDCSEVYPHRDEKVVKVITVDAGKNRYDVVTDTPESLDYSRYGIGGETPTIVFQDGMLAGRELDLEMDDDGNIICEWTADGWRFRIVPAEMDGIVMPGGSFLPAVGNIFRVFGIQLPEAYIEEDTTRSGAAWDMFREGVRYLYDNEDRKFTFTGELDGIWAKKDWVNIGGKIKLGGFVSFSDDRFQPEPVLIRITGIKDYINNPYSPEIELSNSPARGGVSSTLKQIDSNKAAAEELYSSSVNFTKRRFRDAKETISMLEEAMLQGFTESISPITVQTMSLLVGDESLQFRFVQSKDNPQQVAHTAIYDDGRKVLSIADGTIQHMTLGIQSITVTGGHSSNEYRFWTVPAFESPVLSEPQKAYYIYVKVSRTQETGVFYMSETAKKMDAEAGSYYLLMGILNSEMDGSRSYVSLYGFSEILPGRITTDVIRDSDGNLIIDLAQALITAKNGARISGSLTIGPGSSGLENLDEWGDLDQSIKDLAEEARKAQDAAEEAQKTADDAQKEIDGWVADGVISPLEKQGLKNEAARIKADYEDVQSGYSKYGLGNPTDYNLAYVEYYNVLSEILSSPEQNVPVPSSFDTIQDTYYDRWVDALEAIAAAAKDAVSQAQEDANTAQDTADEALQKANEAKDYIDNTLPDEIANINKKLDGVVETWFYPYSPTLSNEPAATWIKDGEQEKHIGDMFLNNQEYVDDETTPDAGKAWRWEKNTSGAYFWNQVADSDAVKALQDAAKAQDTADQKRRVFVTTPYTPYDVGDMWTQGASGDIMRCIKARATGNYAASDWDKASKYTDDAVAQDALAKAGAAQDAADAAQDAADAAQAAASKAQSTADNAVADASDANKQLANLMSDNVITPPEKTALKQQHSDIKAEYSQIIADAQKYGVSTTAYTNAYKSANTALTKYTAASPENITVGSDYNSISAYYTARQTILNTIAAAAKKVADAAQDAADAAQDAADAAQSTADSAAASASQALKNVAAAQSAIQEVRGDLNGLNDTVSDLDEYLDGAFRDGVINDAESISIKKYINTVNESWTDLQASYNVVYNNANLTGTPKTNLKSAYSTLSTRKNALIAAINTAVSNPSTANVTAVDTAFTSYNSAVSAFKTSLENANKAIQDALKRYTDAQIDEIQKDYEQSIATALDQSKDYTDTAKAAIQQSIEALESSKADLSAVYTKSQVDGKVSDAEADAIQAAKEAADAADAALQTVVKAYADGIVDEAEANAIAQANAYAEEKASEARKAAEAAQILAAASMGNMLYTDPEFKKGTNNITSYRRYDAPASANPTLTRKAVAGAPNTSGYGIEIVCPEGQAGFCFSTQTRANRMLVCRFVAKIPEGRTLTHATNATGTDSTLMWLTDRAGTGQWEEYAYYVKAGASGSFSTTFYFYITQAASTTWYLAYATVFDISAASALIENVANAQIAADAAQDTADSLKNFTDTAFADGVIDRAEAASIEKYRNTVNETLKSVTGTYNTLYNNTNLTGTPKSNLKSAYDSLVSAINALLNSIDTAIADSKTNATEKADVDSKYNTVNTRMQTYTQAVEAANESIQAAIKAIADNANNRLNNLEYLEAVFPNSNIIANGALIGQMAVVTDKAPSVSGAKVVAGLNGTDIGKDSTHGKVLMFAGSGGVTEADIKGAKTKIYEDGRIETVSAKIEGDLYATGGRIGSFWTTGSNSFVSQATITYTSGTHQGKKAYTEINLNPTYAYFRAEEEYDGADITVSVSRETDRQTTVEAVFDKDGNLLYQTLGAETRGGLFAKMTASNPSSNTMYAAITAHSDCPGSYASAAFLAEKGMFAGLRPLTKVVSSSYRLTEYDYNVLVLGTGTVILTLDTPPQDGQHYTIWKPNREFTLTIRGNGRLIHRIGTGDASEVTIAKADVVLIEVTYFEDGNKWFLIIHDYR